MGFVGTHVVKFSMAFLGFLGVGCVAPVLAQQQPSSAGMELIVPWGPSGGADQMARKTAKMLERVLGGAISVTNIPGATGNKGMAKLLQSGADSHSMAVMNADTYSLLAYANPGWSVADVVPLAVMTVQASALFVPSNSRFASWADIEKEARAKPGKIRVAITGLGSSDYIALEQFALKGIKFAPTPFGNPQERYQAVMGGQADVLYEQPGDVRAFIEARQMRPVLVFSNARLPQFPETPAAKELNLPLGVTQFRALVVKAGTDPQRIKELQSALDKVAATPEFNAMLKDQWASESSYMSASAASDMLRRELAVMKSIVDQFPLHSRHLFESESVAVYIEPF